MKTSKLIIYLLACSSVALAAPQGTSAPKPPAAANKAAKPALEKGMSAAQVTEVIGKPSGVRVMPAPEGKAEVWTYRRVLERTTDQVATETEEVPVFGIGLGGDSRTAPSMRFSNAYRTRYQVTELLMFNDALVSAKQWQEVAQTYQ